VLADKPSHLLNDDFIDRLYEDIEIQQVDEMPETYNIIQITDWHVDFNYVEGSNRHCNFEICCQAEYGFPEVAEDRARKYGELTCDIPFETARK
jgi:sphingomyelin phosphodiesterase